jgi:hypothetical protein
MEKRDLGLSMKNMSHSAFRVYTFLLLNDGDDIGVRRIQRALGFSSPSSAIFQLEKLMDMKIVERSSDGYYRLKNHEKIGPLRNYLIIRKRLIPWMLLNAFTVTIATLIFLIYFLQYGTREVVVAILPSILASLVLMYEGIRVWKTRPVFNSES